MDAVLLDTDVFSYLLRRGDKRGDVYRAHVEGKTVAVSFVTVGEFYAGAEKRNWSAKRLTSLEERLKAVVIVPFDLEICRIYGRLHASLKTASGSDRVVGSNDLWIAACALRHSLPLITNNRRHFEAIPGLTLISQAAPLTQPSPLTQLSGLFDEPKPKEE